MRRVDQDMARRAAGMLPDPVTSQVRTRYRTLRSMAYSSGLAATYAYVASKSGTQSDLARAYAAVRDGLSRQLVDLDIVTESQSSQPGAVLRALGEVDTVSYLRASAHVRALLGWSARLADAVVGDDEDGGGADVASDRDA
jgi:CRISPR/Cas system CMR-associated protein Cmr5 small subunit